MPLQQGWEEFGNQISKLIARAWLDENFKQQFMDAPKETLASNGIVISEGIEVEIDPDSFSWKIEQIEGSNRAVYKIPLPPKPSEINEVELTKWSEGTDPAPPSMPKSC